ncbi:nuclear pore complex protein DDB_G0274915 [Parasteatoda tepidariorum]|nr:uncharacterized protein LOC107447172 [Parasteatoda tepidariorum]
MDWISSVLCIIVIALTQSAQSQSVRLNPFGGYSDSSFDQLTDFSINQGSYIPSLQASSLYSLMGDDSFTNIGGFPSLNPQMLPFANPLSPVLPQITLSAAASTPMNTKSNVRSPNFNSYPPRTGQGYPKKRGVTLDIRGGGYKLEQQGARPYKAPIAESSVQNPQRVNSGKYNGLNNPKPNSGPPRNRKPNQRPRGPNIKNPHYNGKFESPLASIPPNVEFVNPKNVLPFHPRIYKPFMQQNKQFTSQIQSQNNQKRSKAPSRKPNAGNLNSHQRNPYSSGYNSGSSPPKPTRNRGNPFVSPLASSQSYSPNYQLQESQFPNSPSTSSQFGMQPQQTSDYFQNKPLYSEDLLNQDPSFYGMLSQTPEGRAVLSQMKHQQKKSSHSSQKPQSAPSFTKPPTPQDFMNVKALLTGENLSSFNSGTEHQNAPSSQSSYHGNYGTDSNSQSQKTPNPPIDYQQMLMYYQQQQQSAAIPKPSSSYQSVNGDFSSSLSNGQPNYSLNQNQFSGVQTKNNPYGQQTSNVPHHDFIPQGAGSITYDNPYSNGNSPFNNANVNSFRNTNKQSNQINIKDMDQTQFTLPPFSPTDPLASVDTNKDLRDYYAYQHTVANLKSPTYSNDESVAISSHSEPSAIHEISPYQPDEKKVTEYEVVVQKDNSKSHTSGYMTPEQLFAPQSTGLQSDLKYGYPSHSDSSQSASSTSFSQESAEGNGGKSSKDEQREGSDRAALHLPEDVSIYVARQTENPYVYEYTEAYDPFAFDGSDKSNIDHQSSKETEVITAHREPESDDAFQERIKEIHKLLTKAPKNTYMVNPTEPAFVRPTSSPFFKKDSDKGEMKNHKNTHSYVYQYSPSEKQTAKVSPWQSWKPNASRYHLPIPDAKPQLTTTSAPTTTTTTAQPTTTTYATTESPVESPSAYSTTSYYYDGDTPVCAKHNNLTYCLQDPEYPKDKIKEAIEQNRHPLDHFLVDISASSNVVDDSLNKVFENSVPLQSTAVSYSFEGKAIAPTPNEISNSSGCTSNIYYAKPLRAINTAGQWKIIVNVEFEETGANYTQTVRIEECNYSYGFVATCGTETISACLQQYKLYRLLAWEPHRGFYIDAFLLPISCFCGSHDTHKR